MKKQFFILISLLSTFFFTAAAQSLKLPGDFNVDEPKMIADAHNSLHQLLPEPKLTPLKSTADIETGQLAADLLDYARSFMGTRYRLGGKTPAAFDCSGFTGYVFRQFGYQLGASSRIQYTDGIAVDKDKVQPGDLIFFNGRARNGKVGHVGIAISADPETGVVTFIHASIRSGVRVDKTSSPYYAARFLGARRILPD